MFRKYVFFFLFCLLAFYSNNAKAGALPLEYKDCLTNDDCIVLPSVCDSQIAVNKALKSEAQKWSDNLASISKCKDKAEKQFSKAICIRNLCSLSN